MKSCDLIVYTAWLATGVATDTVVENAAIAIDKGRIAALGTRREIDEIWQARETVSRPDSLLIPGLINAHTHAAMVLLRGVGSDAPLDDWLQSHIWPLEAQHISAEMVRDGTRLAMVEMLKSGTTCFNDMYFFPDTVAEAATQARMRASVGLIVIDFATAWAADADEYLAKAQRVYDDFARSTMISMQFGPHSPYAVSEQTLARVRVLADQLDVGIHIHLHETAREVDEHVQRHGERPFAQLQRMGMVNGNLLAVHMTALTDEEIAAAARSGLNVIHCPESNMKLASGAAPIAALLDAGVNVALGTDGAASNNDLSMLGEMRSAALLGKLTAADATALPAATVLQMATLNGARALGLDDQTGSLEVGKWADMTCIDLGTSHNVPCFDPLTNLVYSAARTDVSDVWVAGRQLLNQRQLTTIDETATVERAREWRDIMRAEKQSR